MEAIKTRKSIRNYTGEALKKSDIALIHSFIHNEKNLIGPFGNTIKIILKEVTELQSSEKVGTYGFIKNAPAFLITICKNNQRSLLDLGFVFENLVLFLEENKLGTCWVGGTFHRKKLHLKEALSEEDFIPIISPVGYATEQPKLFARLIRKLARSDHRMDFDQLFFHNDFYHKISDPTKQALLQFVRLAPSASNKQPWRIVMNEEGSAHFFMERTPKYGSSLGYDIQMVDMGIALSHYVAVSKKDIVVIEDPGTDLPSGHYSYLFSVMP